MNGSLFQIMLICSLIVFSVGSVQADSCRAPAVSALPAASELFEQVDSLLDGVRDSTVGQQAAQAELQRLLPLLAEQYKAAGGRNYMPSSWVFPLAGYGPQAVPGRRGKGFVVKGYDFFTGNRHGGHPAYDIFIFDRNRDDLDDRTGKPVAVLSMTGGVVVSAETGWRQGSKLRGGNYVWVYDPSNDLLVYYAHNRDLTVKQGDLVRPGEKLATVGRTGLNAAKKRSPTHLHMTVLKANNGRPQAVRFWTQLAHTRTDYCQ